MFNVEIDQLLSIVAFDDDDDTRAVVEASTLGLDPGDWPDFIAVVRTSDDGTSAIGDLFVRMGSNGTGHEYSTNEGRILFVLND